MKTLRPYILRRWPALAGAAAATLVISLAELAKPWPLAIVVDHLLTGKPDYGLLAVVAALILAIAIAESIAQYFADLWLQSAGERITHDLRVALYDHLQRLSLAFHQRSQKGDLLTRVTEDVNAMGTLFSDTLGEMVQSGLLALGMTIVLLVIDPVLALLSLATAPLLVLVSWTFRRQVRDRARRQRRHEGDLASIANEALSAMSVVKAFGAEEHEAERVRSRSEQRMGVGVEVARLQARFDGIVGTLRALATAVVTVFGVLRVWHGSLSAGDLIVFVSYTRKAHSPLRSFAREASKLTAALARADRVAEVLSADEVLPDGHHHGGRARGEIALEDVSFAYPGERPALEGVSMTVAAGERVALVGPSGAGKSTLAALVARFYDPTRGVIKLDGRDARDCRLTWLRDQVAVVLQDTVLFTGTVRDNIAYGTDATPQEVIEAAKAAAAHAFIERLPDGYDTELGPQGAGLSGGQRQRIGIARTLLRNPPVIVLDEPTTALDRDSEEQVMQGLDRLMRGRTCILITHSPRLARTADRTVALEHGRVVRRKPVHERLLDPEIARRLLKRDDPELVRVAYSPGRRVDVHYRTGAGDAVLSASGEDLAALVRLAPQLASYDPDEDVLVTWLPFDPRLPALLTPAYELARRLDLDLDGAPELLRYRPRHRAVLRWGAHVLKAYATKHSFDAAVAALRVRAPLRTAAFEAALPDLRLTMQRRLPGAGPDSAIDVAGEAGEAVARLQQARLSLSPAPPERQLAAALKRAGLIAEIAPGVPVARLARRLRETLPASELRPAHGDFHVDQLLLGGDGLAVIDLDGLCLAPPALDLATYAADVVRGRGADSGAIAAVLDPLIDGYGGPPPDLEWHLATAILTRAAHPFQRQADGWQNRVRNMVAAAEAVL
jgi:ATP-binding cassette subfamily B protein/subfamily B ATP-binding cassette protein MsbA